MIPAWFARFMIRLFGVRLIDHNKGDWPKKYIMPVVTHTSNRDFWYGVYSRSILDEYINFVGKSSLFKGPLGAYLKWMGGVPVVREKRSNFVDSVAGIFQERDEFRLALAVEGTRAKVDHFKTGFYFIAKEAKVPLILCRFDFGNEGVIEFSKPYYLTDDIRADFDFIYRYLDGAVGLVPENSFVYDPKVLDLLPKEK
ncbi:MAG: 1-acyl-sn-glycerol-3-phosphate acyltransferase [Neolewinella sp.]|jgi:1-acyl-sn-glycerol-3-phosphate acyltransferase